MLPSTLKFLRFRMFIVFQIFLVRKITVTIIKHVYLCTLVRSIFETIVQINIQEQK
jgi:hypothetical protein